MMLVTAAVLLEEEGNGRLDWKGRRWVAVGA